MKFKNTILLVLFCLFIQCAPKLNYLGNYNTPTNKVAVFFEANKVLNNYTIMGLLNFNYNPSILTNDKNYLLNLIVNKAKEVGADAVLIDNFSNKVYEQLSEDILTKKVVSENIEKLYIEAKFLKLKK